MCSRIHVHLCVLLGLVALIAAGAAVAEPRPGEDPNLPSVPPELPDVTPPAPRGFVLVEEALWTQHLDQPGNEFRVAYRSLTDQDQSAAADALERAAAYVRAEGSRTSEELRARLQAASNELTQLAIAVAAGQAPAFAEIAPVFARTDRVMARHHLQLARRALDDDVARNVGLHLAAAVDQRLDELTWSGQQDDHAAVTQLEHLKEFATKLQEDGAALGSDADRALADLARSLES
ncbi:MAG: hypothetical protein R3D98_01895 [Candidatus Krumholzibacteriia bacterium]